MFERYTRKAQVVLEEAQKAAQEFGHSYIGSEHFLLGILREGDTIAAEILGKYAVTAEKVGHLIEEVISPVGTSMIADAGGYTPRARLILEQAAKESMRMQSQLVGTEHILIAILRENDCAARKILNTLKVDIRRMYVDIYQAMGADRSEVREEIDHMRASKGKTPTLNKYSRDLTALAAKNEIDPVIGRETEIGRIIQILSRRTKNNPCLIGEPGVGKTAVIEGLAQRIADGNVPDSIADKRLVMLDLSGMVAGSKYRGEFEERIKNLIDEVRQDKNVLLFIDEIHTIIGAGGAEGALDASNILKPSLARGEIQIIGATTIDEYRKHIEKDAALERRFQPVMVDEPNEEESFAILQGLRPAYEEHHKVTITDDALRAAVRLSIRYINDRFLPDKAIDLMDEAASKLRLSAFNPPEEVKKLEEEMEKLNKTKEDYIKTENYEKAGEIHKKQQKKQEKIDQLLKKWEQQKESRELTVGAEEIADVVSGWTKIPVRTLEEGETQRLKKLEEILHKRVIGQDEAVSAVARAIRRGRVGLKNPKRPTGSFLFLGPTGVGKTELSKALAEAIFGTENALIRVDMTEYMEKHSVSKLVGSPPGYVGYEEGGQLSEKVRRNPYSVILFDEIEKAHPDVFNILLQVLDDGRITDSQGRKVDFRNTVLIMTSNCGAANIISPKRLGFGATSDAKADYEYMKTRVMDEVKQMFKPEFLNRIDEQIVFHSLGREQMIEIAEVMLTEICDRVKEQMNITLDIDAKAKSWLVEHGYDEKYGARPLRRTIQTALEDKLAEEILEGNIKKGDTVIISADENGLTFNKKA